MALGTGLRRMGTEDLPRVLAWRNHPEIRRYMFSQHEIDPREHQRWFERASADASRHLLIFEISDHRMGYVSFHQLDGGPVVDWGFYVAPDAARGTGAALGNAALAYAFDVQRFHKVCGQALSFNERSIRLHLRLGFVQEGLLRDHHFDGQHFHSVACFGLLADDWRRNAKDEHHE